MAQGNQDPLVLRVAMLQGSVLVQSISALWGYGRVETLLPYCLPLKQFSASAHISSVSHQNKFPLCLRHAQAFSVGHLVLELLKRLLLSRAPAPVSGLLDEVRQEGVPVGEILYVVAVEVATPNEAAYITECYLGVFMLYLSIHQSFGLRGSRCPSSIENVKPQVLHSLLHELTLLQLESSVVPLADSKEPAQEDYLVLLGVRSQAYIIDVCFNLGASGYEFLHHGSTL